MVLVFLNKVSQKWIFWVLADVIIFLVLAFIAWHNYPAQNQSRYQLDIALKIVHGQIPYIDFESEYPPLTLLFFLLPGLMFRSVATYYIAFVIELLVFDIFAMALIKRIAPRFGISTTRALSIHALMLITAGIILVVSFDIIPAVMVLAASVYFMSGKSNIAWAFAGLGFMTKIYPIIILPIFVFYQLRQKQYRQLIQGAAIFILIVLALSLPWLAVNAKGYLATYTYHIDRGLHSESVYGSFLLLGKLFGVVNVDGIVNFGSWNLSSPLADQLAKFSFVIMGGLLSAVYILYIRDVNKWIRHPLETAALKLPPATILLKYVTSVTFIFMLSSKVLSMQYLIWVCLLLPLITGRWQVHILVSFLIAGYLSQLVYPAFYKQFMDFAPFTLVMMFARNILLIVCAVLVLLPGERKLNSEPKALLKSAAG
jgi:uncharacterized membrane protein